MRANIHIKAPLFSFKYPSQNEVLAFLRVGRRRIRVDEFQTGAPKGVPSAKAVVNVRLVLGS